MWKKTPKRRQFPKKTLYFVFWNGCSNKVDKPLILLVKEDFLLDISVSDAIAVAISKSHQKTLKIKQNVIFYMCRMTHRLDMGHPSFCSWNVIFTDDSMQIIHMVG